MKVYKFECESCGSKQYLKTKNGYKCKYCGTIQDVISSGVVEEKQPKADIEVNQIINSTPSIKHNVKNALIMLLVCVFAGVYGIHKFMERKIFLGILYLCTFGLLGIGWFIDVVRYGLNLAVEWKNSGGES